MMAARHSCTQLLTAVHSCMQLRAAICSYSLVLSRTQLVFWTYSFAGAHYYSCRSQLRTAIVSYLQLVAAVHSYLQLRAGRYIRLQLCAVVGGGVAV